MFVALLSCAPADEARFSDGLHSDSPCYEVNLLDGLDDASPDEFLSLFDCANRFDHLDALVPVRNGLELPASSGDPGAIELVRALNGAWEDPIGAFEAPEQLSDDELGQGLLDLFLESVGGRPAHTLSSSDPPDPAQGPLALLGPSVTTTSAALRADVDLSDFLGAMIRDPETARWVRSFSSVASSSDPALADRAAWLPHVGEAIAATRTPGNDRWSYATGDSLRDLVDVVILGPNPALVTVAPALEGLLTDPIVLGALPGALVRLSEDGHLAPAGAQLAWLTNVDAAGDPLGDGDDSALYRFIRLLDEANAPVDCALDLILFEIGFFHVDNLAVSVLSLLADLDPDTVDGGADVLGSLLGSELTLGILHLLIDGVDGTCDGLTHEIVDDLAAVESLSGPEADDLLATLVVLLDVAQEGESDHLWDIPGVAEPLLNTGALRAGEELLRDTAGGSGWTDVVGLLPVLLAPSEFLLSAGDEAAVDLSDAVDLLRWFVAEDETTGQRGWSTIAPVLAPALAQDGLWSAVGRLGELLQDPTSQAARSLDLLPLWLEADPDLKALSAVADLADHPPVRDPTLALLATPELLDTLLATAPVEGHLETPLGWASRLVVDGTLHDVATLVDDVFDSF